MYSLKEIFPLLFCFVVFVKAKDFFFQQFLTKVYYFHFFDIFFNKKFQLLICCEYSLY